MERKTVLIIGVIIIALFSLIPSYMVDAAEPVECPKWVTSGGSHDAPPEGELIRTWQLECKLTNTACDNVEADSKCTMWLPAE